MVIGSAMMIATKNILAEHEDAPDDSYHPYMDDYEDIRSEYIRFLEWER